ncbi:hypothetical protein TRV_02787 [Trichophyton verrucosum HKI 0517]|uniref:Uncharacterized protein n=1 Tax=Trichophyton verrucosum (strain HKI 0517) TaxID=663202 RepID=D4D6R0_TRIVH|nr:uncharacterized protein TRV_02787 [Trichophyton verrucosum HKI 0517]EFE42479.1 hypothetical protein TRV_02787 [Trichophyton verrucosum HKI 0517]
MQLGALQCEGEKAEEEEKNPTEESLLDKTGWLSATAISLAILSAEK